MILGGVIPAACFLLGRHEWGLIGGVVLVVLWSLAYQAARWFKTRSISGLILIYLMVLALRSTGAIAFNSARMFYITPLIVTFIGGGVFIASGLLSRPLVSPIVNELVPNTVLDCKDPKVRSVMVKITYLYGAEQLVCAAVLTVMVLNMSTTLYVTTHGVVSTLIMGLMVLAGIPLVWRELRTLIQWEKPVPQAAVAVAEPLAFQPAPEIQAQTASGF
jgi:intracellular septation protein A